MLYTRVQSRKGRAARLFARHTSDSRLAALRNTLHCRSRLDIARDCAPAFRSLLSEMSWAACRMDLRFPEASRPLRCRPLLRDTMLQAQLALDRATASARGR